MRARLALGAVLLGLGAILWPPVTAILPALANLAGAWRFAATLQPGKEPLIARYTRFDHGVCPAEVAGYSRRLTTIWAWFLLLFSLAHGLALAGIGTHAAVLAVEVAAGLGLFLGEHAVRNRVFPHHGRATPVRTIRAVRLAHAGPSVAAPHAS